MFGLMLVSRLPSLLIAWGGQAAASRFARRLAIGRFRREKNAERVVLPHNPSEFRKRVFLGCRRLLRRMVELPLNMVEVDCEAGSHCFSHKLPTFREARRSADRIEIRIPASLEVQQSPCRLSKKAGAPIS
jgi:hypothetical protein